MKILNMCPVKVGQRVKMVGDRDRGWVVGKISLRRNNTVVIWTLHIRDTDMVFGVMQNSMCGLEVCGEDTE